MNTIEHVAITTNSGWTARLGFTCRTWLDRKTNKPHVYQCQPQDDSFSRMPSTKPSVPFSNPGINFLTTRMKYNYFKKSSFWNIRMYANLCNSFKEDLSEDLNSMQIFFFPQYERCIVGNSQYQLQPSSGLYIFATSNVALREFNTTHLA